MGWKKRAAAGRARDKVEAMVRVQSVVGPLFNGLSIKEKISYAADQLDWPISRVENIWHREAARIEAWEMEELRNFVPRDG